VNNNYDIIDVKQGSKEWLETRRKYITASQVPALMGLSPYETINDILINKITGKEKDTTGKEALFSKGHYLENQMRTTLNLQGYSFEPKVVVSKIVPDLLASLDGIEHKEDHDIIMEAKYVGRDKISAISVGVIPAHHRIQVQAQLLATGARSCLYIATDGRDQAFQTIIPDEIAQAQIKRAIEEFKTKLSTTNISPIADTPIIPAEWVTLEDPRLNELCQLKVDLDLMTDRFDELKKEVTNHYSNFPKFKGGGIKIIKSNVKGSIKYSDIPEIKNMDLEKYRGKERIQYTLSFDDQYFNDKEEEF
jgi:putative phage-type endonuclease